MSTFAIGDKVRFDILSDKYEQYMYQHNDNYGIVMDVVGDIISIEWNHLIGQTFSYHSNHILFYTEPFGSTIRPSNNNELDELPLFPPSQNTRFAIGDRVTMNPDSEEFEKYYTQHNESAGTVVEKFDVGSDKTWVHWDCQSEECSFFYYNDSLLLLSSSEGRHTSPFDLFDDEMESFDPLRIPDTGDIVTLNIGDYVIYNPKSRTFKELFSHHNGDKGVIIDISPDNLYAKIQWMNGSVGNFYTADLILSQYDEVEQVEIPTPTPKKRVAPDRHIFLPGDMVMLKESSTSNRERIARNGSSIFYVIDSNFDDIKKSQIDKMSQSSYDMTTCKLMYQNDNQHFNVNYVDIDFMGYNGDDILKVGSNYYAIMTKPESMRKLDEYFITNLKKVSNSIIFDENYRNNILTR